MESVPVRQRKEGREDGTKRSQNRFPPQEPPPPSKNLDVFEKELYAMIGEIKFRKYNNKLMDSMKEDVRQINDSDRVFVFADKSSNFYKMKPDKYMKLMEANIKKQD